MLVYRINLKNNKAQGCFIGGPMFLQELMYSHWASMVKTHLSPHCEFHMDGTPSDYMEDWEFCANATLDLCVDYVGPEWMQESFEFFHITVWETDNYREFTSGQVVFDLAKATLVETIEFTDLVPANA